MDGWGTEIMYKRAKLSSPLESCTLDYLHSKFCSRESMLRLVAVISSRLVYGCVVDATWEVSSNVVGLDC